ncbi:MAG: hypothetical protein HOE69_02990 [Euryarchaeota archaeon]|jgi:hypothetical protein|nr:hypothetical protein [Euryarchaeota archaeon]
MGELRMPSALLLATLFLMAIPASIADTGDNTVMQDQTGEQPSHENNTFYLWGRNSGTPCWGHFNNSDSGTDPSGYAEQTQANGKMEVEWTCRMDPQLNEDFALENEAEIQVHLMIDVQGVWENGNGCNGDCENLNISLMKGGLEVAKYEYTAMNTGENEIVITFPVNETLQVWDDSTDNPALRVRMVLYASSGIFCAIPGVNCDAQFRMYYSGQEEAQYNGTVTFPILNDTASEDILGNGDDNGGGDDDGLPGFGIFAAASAIGIAAFARRKQE